jgi:hypothetical protein
MSYVLGRLIRCWMFERLKTKLVTLFTFNSYLAENKVRLRYKDELVSSVYRNILLFVRRMMRNV